MIDSLPDVEVHLRKQNDKNNLSGKSSRQRNRGKSEIEAKQTDFDAYKHNLDNMKRNKLNTVLHKKQNKLVSDSKP